MDLNVLDYFLRVAELGSVNRAAQDLRLSQASLSRKLMRLELDMGTPLFVRDTTGTRLTEAGSLLANRARPLLHEASLLKHEVGREGAALVSLALPSSWNRMITVPFVARITAQHPDYQVHIYDGITSALGDWIQQRIVDIGITVAYTRTPQFKKIPIIDETCLLVGPLGSGLSLEAPISAHDLSKNPIILPGTSNPLRRHLEALLTKQGLALKSVIQAESIHLCIEMAAAGLGHTILPYSAFHYVSRSAKLCAAPIEDFSIPWALTINLERIHSIAVERVARKLEEFILLRAASGEWRFASQSGTSA